MNLVESEVYIRNPTKVVTSLFCPVPGTQTSTFVVCISEKYSLFLLFFPVLLCLSCLSVVSVSCLSRLCRVCLLCLCRVCVVSVGQVLFLRTFIPSVNSYKHRPKPLSNQLQMITRLFFLP